MKKIFLSFIFMLCISQICFAKSDNFVSELQSKIGQKIEIKIGVGGAYQVFEGQIIKILSDCIVIKSDGDTIITQNKNILYIKFK